jgi:ssDNA-binding Zn-finger/Zn-ribbon topoisomerase 1
MTKLSGLDVAQALTSSRSVDVVCPWCERTASITVGPQHAQGTVDYHCVKCGRFSSHQVKIADAWFDQHNEKLRKEREVWKRIPPTAYITCRRSATSGASFVYTLYTGKGQPREYLSRDSVEQALIDEFGMSWEQANAILISAGLQSHGGAKIYLRQLTKISSALAERQVVGTAEKRFSRGDVVRVNGKEALFLRYANDNFAVVAFPGIGDTEVPVIELEVVDTGTPKELGFDFVGDPEELLEEEIVETLKSDVEHVTEHVKDVLEHEKAEGGEPEEVRTLEKTVEHLEHATEQLQDFVTEEKEEVDAPEESKKQSFRRQSQWTKEDLLNAYRGPALEAYVYKGEPYCIECGRKIIEKGPEVYSEDEGYDENVVPQPIFLGELEDYPPECTRCERKLYDLPKEYRRHRYSQRDVSEVAQELIRKTSPKPIHMLHAGFCPECEKSRVHKTETGYRCPRCHSTWTLEGNKIARRQLVAQESSDKSENRDLVKKIQQLSAIVADPSADPEKRQEARRQLDAAYLEKRFRHMLLESGTCPNCRELTIQKTEDEYRCPTCHATWTQYPHRANARALSRRQLIAQESSDIQEKLRTLFNIINDPETDPETREEAQRQWNLLKRRQAVRKTAWWYKAPWETEYMERPDQVSQAPRETPRADQSALYPREGDEYPSWKSTTKEAATKSELLRGGLGLDGYIYRGKLYCIPCGSEIIAQGPDVVPDEDAYDSDVTPQPIFFGEHELPQHCSQCGAYLYGGNLGDYEAKRQANRAVQQKVHAAFHRSGDLKQAITEYRHALSIADIREILRFYKASGKLASHEADELAQWFIGTKPRLLSARQLVGKIVGRPGAYYVKSEEGKNLGGPYKTREQAKKRLEQVHYFSQKKSTAAALSKRALLDKGMGIFQPAMYRGREVLVIAIDNTGNRATVEDSQRRQFQVDVADLTPTSTGPYTHRPR